MTVPLVVAALGLTAGCKRDEPGGAEGEAARPSAPEAAGVPEDVTWSDVQKQFQKLERERESVMALVQEKAGMISTGQKPDIKPPEPERASPSGATINRGAKAVIPPG